MGDQVRENSLKELRDTGRSANSLLRSNILVISSLIAGISFLSKSGNIGLKTLNTPLFSVGIGFLFGSIILSMQTNIYRWTENSTIIPIELYREESEKAVELTASQLQNSVRQARGILYPAYILFTLGLTCVALSILQISSLPSQFRISFLIPLIITFVILVWIEKKKRWRLPI